MTSIHRPLAALAALLLLITLPAEAQRMGIGIRAGTLGVGADFSYAALPNLNVRFAGSALPASVPATTVEDENVDVEFTGDATILAFSALADFYPFRNFFRLSGGLTYNGSNASATGEPTDSYSIRSRTFSREQIGSLSADVEYGNTLQPYLGLGVGNPTAGGRVGFLFDAGILVSGSPEVTMSGTGMIEPTATENEAIIQDAMDGIEIYPVLAFGISIRL